MIDVDEWANKWSRSEEKDDLSICFELAKAVDGFLEHLKDKKNLSIKTINSYLRDLSLFGYELTRDIDIHQKICDSIKDYEGESFLPDYFCISRKDYKFDEKALNTYENRIDKFWDYYNKIYSCK